MWAVHLWVQSAQRLGMQGSSWRMQRWTWLLQSVDDKRQKSRWRMQGRLPMRTVWRRIGRRKFSVSWHNNSSPSSTHCQCESSQPSQDPVRVCARSRRKPRCSDENLRPTPHRSFSATKQTAQDQARVRRVECHLRVCRHKRAASARQSQERSDSKTQSTKLEEETWWRWWGIQLDGKS